MNKIPNDTVISAFSDKMSNASCEFIVEADKGQGEWYTFSRSDTEYAGRCKLATAKAERTFERHRLIRRIIFDVELA